MMPSAKIARGVAVLLLAALAACSPLKTINALTPSDTYRKTANLSYGSDARHRLDIYSPSNVTEASPVVVFFYGGSWNSGERGDYAFVGEALASRGIVAVLADYRLYPEVRYPVFLEDAAQAVAWTKREVRAFGGDPRRLFLMGHSAGAYNAAMLALDKRWLAPHGMAPSELNGWIGLAGPYDFIPIQNADVRPIFFYPSTPPESQPANHVTSAAPPALLIAPQDDDVVNPVRNTGGLAKRLRAAGVPVIERYFDGIGHVTLVAALSRPLRRLAPVLDAVGDFMANTSSKPAQ